MALSRSINKQLYLTNRSTIKAQRDEQTPIADYITTRGGRGGSTHGYSHDGRAASGRQADLAHLVAHAQVLAQQRHDERRAEQR